MTQHQSFYLFGDQTFDVEPHLHTLLAARRGNPVLGDFLDKVYNALRLRTFQIPAAARTGWPTFTAIEDVLLWKPSECATRCVSWDMAVTCIYQLGSFIINHTDRRYPTAESTTILGMCTGALAAVTIGCSRNLSDLIPKAVQAVVTAFNVGLCVSSTAKRFSSEEQFGRPWFVMVAGSAAAQAVHNFRQASNLPAASKPFISAFTPNGVAVSGPPTSLDALVVALQSLKLRYTFKPVYAPYHAPHLYSAADIEEILEHMEPEQENHLLGSQVPVMAGDGQMIVGSNHRDLLRIATEHILLKPIQWQGILDGLRSSLEKSVGPKDYQIEAYGSRADPLLRSALKLVGRDLGQPSSIPAPSTNPVHETDSRRPKIAIIGMSGRFPGGANSVDQFWDVLREGLDVHEEVPSLHWSQAHVDPTGSRKNTSATPYGCWLSDPAAFDARFFNISPREAPQIDPAQRIALMTAYEALEQAGVVADATPSTRRDRVGVFYGVTSNDWMETNSAQNIDTYFIPGGNRAFIPGRINYFFKFSGPSYATDTACSSSLAAIHTAINSLWQRDIDTAIAGGTNVLTNPDFTSGLDRGHFLSRTGNCKTFDDSADGYCRGEAIGTVILKRLDDAIAEHDPILGVISGAYTNHSAQAESITRPHTGAQRAIFSKILNSSNVEPGSVGYIEMHGTGTQAGDATEMSSTLQVFAPGDRSPRQTPIYLGSAKSNIGHGEAASGVSSLIKVLLMMKHNSIPPHVGIKTEINSKFPKDLQTRNVHIAKQSVAWLAENDAPRRAFVNNFSAAGGNTALLLEDAPSLNAHAVELSKGSKADGLIAVSAKTGTALQGNLASLKEFLLSRKESVSPAELSYTTTARRMHHAHRAMLVGSSVDELITQIDVAVRNEVGVKRSKNKTPNIIFAFTGQGAQFPGMGRQMMETFALFRKELRQLDHIARSLGFPSIMPVYMAEEGQTLDDFPPVQVQMASVSMQIALARLWASWNILPQAVVGHSLGEYAALNVAGVLCDADTLYLVGKRAELLQRLCTKGTHCMLVVRAAESTVRTTLRDTRHQIACMNSPIETVLAGPAADIANAATVLTNAGIKTTRLEIPFAFHSSQVDPVLAPFEDAAANVRFLEPKYPVLCPLDGSVVTKEGKFDPTYLARHCREPVNMLGALSTARQQGIISEQPILLEIGPHPAVSGMVKATLGADTTVISAMNRKASRSVLVDALKVLYQAGADIEWRTYHEDFTASQKVVTDLPAYSWDLKPYWIQYVNDWSLRKGEAANSLQEAVPVHKPTAARQKVEKIPEKTPELQLESTTIHRIVQHSSSNDNMRETIWVEADISRPDMNPLVQGHMVDDVPLCTPSVYADMALTLGRGLVKQRQHRHQQVDVSNMSIFKALIARKSGPQPLQARAEVDWAKNEAAVSFVSFDTKGKVQEHAKCALRFTDRDLLLQRLREDAASTKASMSRLRQGIASETTARFNRPMVYRMIRPLAQFHDDYRAIDEVILDSATLEASASVSFGGIKKEGTFALHPAIIDAFTQSCGFAMNCNDSTDLDKEVYMNHGWAGFQVFEDVHFDRPYTSYTRMVEGKDKIWNGDVTIFDGDKIVAAFEGIEIQCVPRRVLKVILSLESGIKSSKPTAPAPRVEEVPAVRVKPTTIELSIPVSNTINGAVLSKEPVVDTTISTALQIISEESGVTLEELSDASAFADLGVDSLLGLSIEARFREELELDLDFDAMFMHHPTVGDLKNYLRPALKSEPCLAEEPVTIVSPRPTLVKMPPMPPMIDECTNAAEEVISRLSGVDMTGVLQIVSEESGIDIEELTDDTNFADTGIDSLLGLVIVSRFRDELELSTPMDTLFVDCTTIADLKNFLAQAGVGAVAQQEEPLHGTCDASSSSGSDTGRSTPMSSSDFGSLVSLTPMSEMTMLSDDEDQLLEHSVRVPRTTSLVLQGNPKTATKTLFLFPDGCGSASSYAQIPNMSRDTCVVALNCPFLKEPERLRKARLDDLITQGYLAEIRRRQPHGPYHLGGWSAGGILAYRATQLLQEAHEQVLSLNLIDSPPPIRGLDRLPPHFYEYCESLHLFGHKSSNPASTGRPPAWLIPHFNATIDLLHEYIAAPLKPVPGLRPVQVNLLWAATSISDNPNLPKLAPHPDDTEGMKFLLETRKDFGGNGWEKLFPRQSLTIDKVHKAHHFSMMREPYSQKLADFLKKGMNV